MIQHFKCEKSLYFDTPLAFKPQTEGFPWDDLPKIFRGCQRMANLPNGEEKLPKIPTGWVGCTNVTDRRQTHGTAIAYSKREREFTFANKHSTELPSRTIARPVSSELLGFWFLIFPYFFVSVPCTRLSWPSRQLFSNKSTVSYRIVSYRQQLVHTGATTTRASRLPLTNRQYFDYRYRDVAKTNYRQAGNNAGRRKLRKTMKMNIWRRDMTGLQVRWK